LPAATIPSGQRVEVEALGSGRAWHFSYGGRDGIPGTADDAVSTGDLTLPENADVVIHLRSRDYIYVFSCPGLNLKEIAVPDLEFSLAFRTGAAGRHELAMDPMCGFPAAPGETMGALRVVSQGGFQSWLDSCHHRPP
jgi:heme/copper-type cytochrome/quinol oxidase subunit 2